MRILKSKMRSRNDNSSASQCITLAVAAQKGGVGKTTTAVHLAWDLATRLHRRVLLIDLDAQGHVHTHLSKFTRVETTKHLGEVLLERRGDIMDVVVPTGIKNLHYTCADKTLHQVEIQLNARIGKEMVLQRALLQAREHYDVILLDCPPNLGNLTVSALVACDSVVVPTDSSKLSLEGVSDILKTLDILEDTFGRAPNLEGILLTRMDRRSKRYNQEVRETITQLAGDLLFDAEIPAQTLIARAQSQGTTIFELDAASSAAIAYQELTDELAQSLGLRATVSSRLLA